MDENIKLAVLIDADNAQASVVKELLREVAKYGTASVKRVYGDWTSQSLKGWKEQLHRHAIQPIQQFSYTKGKNATDSSLIIDAMDLLHADHVEGFCLVSSDSDFTRLATRLRESGKSVFGFGERKTPEAFVSACDKFVYTEILRQDSREKAGEIAEPQDLKSIVVDAVEATSKEDDWSPLSRVGWYISKNNPSFDSRNYGYGKLGELVRAQSYLEIKEVGDGGGNVHLWVRVRGK